MGKPGFFSLLPQNLLLKGALTALLALCASCSGDESAPPLEVVSWTGEDQQPVALDQVLKIEFNQALANPMRASSLQMFDEGHYVVENMTAKVVGRWIYITPMLPKNAALTDGSLLPAHNYGIQLSGLPWLRALASSGGTLLEKDLILPFRTADADSPGALAGRGVESSGLRLEGPGGREPVTFRRGEKVLLHFTRGIDPRSVALPARWRVQGQEHAVEVSMRLLENRIDGSILEVMLEDWRGAGALELPAGIEGLGGWPFPESERVIHLVRRAQE